MLFFKKNYCRKDFFILDYWVVLYDGENYFNDEMNLERTCIML